MILTESQCTEIISWHTIFSTYNVRNCPNVVSTAGLHKSRLDYNLCEVRRNEMTQWFFDLISDFLKTNYPNNTVNNREYFYIHKFEEGHRFGKHIDKDRMDEWVLVVGAILNSEFEGGRLITYNPDGELATKAGEIYKMDASILHEVTEVTSGVRYSFVFFISHSELGIKKSII